MYFCSFSHRYSSGGNGLLWLILLEDIDFHISVQRWAHGPPLSHPSPVWASGVGRVESVTPVLHPVFIHAFVFLSPQMRELISPPLSLGLAQRVCWPIGYDGRDSESWD